MFKKINNRDLHAQEYIIVWQKQGRRISLTMTKGEPQVGVVIPHIWDAALRYIKQWLTLKGEHPYNFRENFNKQLSFLSMNEIRPGDTRDLCLENEMDTIVCHDFLQILMWTWQMFLGIDC